MDIKQAIRANLAASDFLVQGYLADLTDAELLARPCKGANHIAWQLGHLIAAERHLIEQAAPGKMPALPAGFAERHKKETAALDDAKAFLTKAEYLALAKQIRAAALDIVAGMSEADFDKPVTKVPPFIKTAGELFLFLGPHWTMHAGQWAVTRRSLGRAPLF
jgi:uncharacterized damage-inducible protein DinB